MRRSTNRFLPVLAALVAVPLALTACSGDDADADSDTNGEGTSGGGADGGTLTLGIHQEPTAWDASRVQTILFPFTRQLYDSLVEYDDELNPEPRLATEWEINDDQSAVTVTLRDDVVFHSGRQLTAEDVAANLEYFADSETGQQLNGPMAVVDSWEATDETTLEVTFTQPISELQITDLLQSWTIGDPEAFGEVDSRAVGTGPFKFVEWLPGESVTLERNEDYWGEVPAYSELEYRIFDDMDSLISGFESGVLDIAVDAPPLDASRLEGENTVLVGAEGALIDQWRLNPTSAPLDNQDVRMAINYATDREAIVQALYHGFSQAATLPYSTASPAYDEELASSLEYDLARAEQHIQDSGLSADELTATISVNSASAPQQQAAQIMQASLAEIGFTLDIEVLDTAEYVERQLAGDFQIMYAAIGNGQKFPTRITTNSIYRLQDNPVSALEVFPDYEPAVAAANSAVTEEEQAQAFANLNQVLVDSMWVPTVGYLPRLWVISPEVQGVDRNIDNMIELGGAAPAS